MKRDLSKVRFASFVAFVLFSPEISYANPIVVNPIFEIAKVAFTLGVESALVAILLIQSGLLFFRFLKNYFAANCFTFFVLLPFSITLYQSLAQPFLYEIINLKLTARFLRLPIDSIIVAEIAVILFEAFIILHLQGQKLAGLIKQISKPKAIFLSFLGNLFSFTFGILLFSAVSTSSFKMGPPPVLEEYFSRKIHEASSEGEIKFYKGRLAHESHNFEEANKLYEESEKDGFNKAELYIHWGNIGWAYPESAFRESKYLMALQLEPQNATAMRSLAYLYSQEGEIEKAKPILDKLKVHSDPCVATITWLISKYENTTKKVISDLNEMAYHGDPKAQGELSRLYSLGWGLRRSTASSSFWEYKAAEFGSPNCAHNIGNHFDYNKTKREAELAYFWFSVADKLGSPNSHRWRDYSKEFLNREEIERMDQKINSFCEKVKMNTTNAKNPNFEINMTIDKEIQ